MDARNDFRKFALSKGVYGSLVDDVKIENHLNPNILEERTNISSMATIDIYSRLLMDRQLFLGMEIDDEVSNIFIAQLLWLEQQGERDIQILINSPGGSVSSGLAIVDTMNFISCKIGTTIIGTAASMASVIACNGYKGKRDMLPHSRFMIHQPLQRGIGGQCSDILINAEQIKICRDELYEILSQNSNLSVEEITNMADRDCWIRANEAVKYGFVDSIITSKKLLQNNNTDADND